VAEGVNPTTENLVVAIWQRLEPELPAGSRLVRLVLWETPRNYVEYTGAVMRRPGGDDLSGAVPGSGARDARAAGRGSGAAGLLKTPERVEKSLTWLTRGYGCP
jgi:hypothetical protein